MKSLLHGIICVLLMVIAGCGGGSGGDGAPQSSPGTGAATVSRVVVHVQDVTGAPIVGATVTVTSGGIAQQRTTDGQGAATFDEIRGGSFEHSVTAAGFELFSASTDSVGNTANVRVTMKAQDAWAIGSTLVLGSRVLERAADGSALTFSMDVAVVDADSRPIENLTASQFRIDLIDCGWGGPRDCASDADGRASGNHGHFRVDGDAQNFTLQPPGTRRPYAVGVLAGRSASGPDWSAAGPALRSFFAALSGNDTASLMTVYPEGSATAFRSYGSFTSDGSTFFDAIDDLATPVAGAPTMPAGVTEAITRTAEAEAFGLADVERHVLVIARQGLTAHEVRTTAQRAVDAGVKVSNIVNIWSDEYGLSELAARSGGLIASTDDPRQLGMVFGALDAALSGVLPSYRMEFRLTADASSTFMPGGNVKLHLVVSVPSPLPNRGVLALADIAIP